MYLISTFSKAVIYFILIKKQYPALFSLILGLFSCILYINHEEFREVHGGLTGRDHQFYIGEKSLFFIRFVER